jgi:hypothetical protein
MGCPASVEIGDNLVFSICTHDPDTGVLTDADSAPAYRVYEDETSTAILSGTMAILDTSNTTGFYTESLACTSGNGFEAGKTYTVYIEATVDGDKGGIAYGFKAVSHAFAPTKGVELANVMFMMVDATDLNTPETSVTVTATISKDGGAFASCSNSASEVSGGWYKITLTSTEMTADSIALKFTGTGCAQRNLAFRTQPNA